MKAVIMFFFRSLLGGLALALAGCQAARGPSGGPSFAQDPTDSGSRYSETALPGTGMGMQNVDLED